MSGDSASRQIANLGKGLIQVNLRLNRILEMLEEGGPARTDSPHTALLLDLTEAAERTLEATAALSPPTWWQRLLGVRAFPPPDDGLRLALDRIRDALTAEQITPIPRTGPVDPRLHQVIEVLPTADPDQHEHIAQTLRRGWQQRGVVLRLAQVTAWKCTPGASS